MTEKAKTDASNMRELISFRIGDQEFCVDIMSVREIRGWTPATALPHSPGFVRGVIIVAQVGSQVVGLLVDAVSDILTMAQDAIQPTPEVASDMARSFVRGVLAVEGRMISLIGLDEILPIADKVAA